ncbi:MAG TPA: glycosyltransferase [Luteimonas sp.]|nr:glycosyltransferase [Luteimonas sp.]
MQRQLCFHRDFRRYSGGHGKVWDYFRHAEAHPAWEARVYLAPGSVDADNPWRAHPRVRIAPDWPVPGADALFLGGLDWEAWPADLPARPVINLVQHVRHGDPADPRFAFLSRRAVRICVSQAVADAILASGRVNGPVRVIEAGLELPAPPTAAPRDEAVFIGALKQPVLGRALAAELQARGRRVLLADHWQARADYLRQLGSCTVAVLLPNPTEGFYLPALEAMALGTAVVVPDCLGNRAYLQPGSNARVPAAEVVALAAAVAELDDPASRARAVEAGHATAARFGLARERRAFHAILDDLDALWRA